MNDITALLQAMANEYMIDLEPVYNEFNGRECFKIRRQGATGSEPTMYIHIYDGKLELVRTFESYDGSRIKEVFLNG